MVTSSVKAGFHQQCQWALDEMLQYYHVYPDAVTVDCVLIQAELDTVEPVLGLVLVAPAPINSRCGFFLLGLGRGVCDTDLDDVDVSFLGIGVRGGFFTGLSLGLRLVGFRLAGGVD